MSSRILYIQYTNPASLPPLEHSSRILADAGWEVIFAGTGVGGLERLEFPPHSRVRVRLMRSALPGWRQKVHYLAFCAWVVGLAIWYRPRWVYASDLFACLPGFVLRTLRFRVIYHEHDHPGPPTSASLRILNVARRWLARRVQCITPNEDRARIFRGETGAARVAVVWNCPARDEVRSTRRKFSPASELSVFYAGVVGRTLLPVNTIRALAAVSAGVRLNVVGYEVIGGEGYTRELQSVAEKLGLSDRVIFLGPMPRRSFYDIAATCHVGLVMLPRDSTNVNIRYLLGASNKAFDYLACGLALLVTECPEWEAFVRQAGVGRTCDPANVTSIATALQWFADHPLETRAMGENGRRRVLNEWNYTRQFNSVAKLMGASIGR